MLRTDACWQGTLLSKQTNQNLCGDSGTLVLQWGNLGHEELPLFPPASVLVAPASPSEWW